VTRRVGIGASSGQKCAMMRPVCIIREASPAERKKGIEIGSPSSVVVAR
jgi:hypothetical protein